MSRVCRSETCRLSSTRSSTTRTVDLPLMRASKDDYALCLLHSVIFLLPQYRRLVMSIGGLFVPMPRLSVVAIHHFDVLLSPGYPTLDAPNEDSSLDVPDPPRDEMILEPAGRSRAAAL